jgi:hypothetical protein
MISLSDWLWNPVAWLVSRIPVANYLIKRAQHTPYFHLEGYMDRWWLFNPYGLDRSLPEAERHTPIYPSFRSYRIHHILREDLARDMHNHPWPARTIILKGWYWEDRDDGLHFRTVGDTATLEPDTFHNITQVSPGGVWTLFITGPYEKDWGFMTKDGFVPHEEYENAAG